MNYSSSHSKHSKEQTRVED